LYTRFVEDHIAELVAPGNGAHRRLFFEQAVALPRAGTKIDTADPLAVLAHGKAENSVPAATNAADAAVQSQTYDVVGPENTVAIKAPLQGTIVSVDVREGELVRKGQQLVVMESMKMEHVIQAETSGIIRQLVVTKGDTLFEGHPLAFIEETEVETAETAGEVEVDLDHIRPDLAEVIERQTLTLDAARPEAPAPRRQPGHPPPPPDRPHACEPA